MKPIVPAFVTVLLAWHGAGAASFDCMKARSAHERHICTSVELSVADSRLGEAYKAATQSFPIRGFVLATQRRFLLSYQFCDGQYGPSCTAMVADRIAVLRSMVAPIAVYSSGNPAEAFNPEDGVFWIAVAGEGAVLHYFGSAMPDMNTQASFPEGFVCDDSLPLVSGPAGYATSGSDEEVTVTDRKIRASIMCSPRNRMDGTYARVR